MDLFSCLDELNTELQRVTLSFLEDLDTITAMKKKTAAARHVTIAGIISCFTSRCNGLAPAMADQFTEYFGREARPEGISGPLSVGTTSMPDDLTGSEQEKLLDLKSDSFLVLELKKYHFSLLELMKG